VAVSADPAPAPGATTGPEPHPAIAPIAFLLGTWEGEGSGEYPTIEPFGYREVIRFWQVGKPFLAYSQQTWSLADGSPMHAEVGYWRSPGDGRVELVLAHPGGVVEIEEGLVTATTIDLSSRSVTGTSTAKLVTTLARRVTVSGDRLVYELDMGAVGQPHQRHLEARLTRTG
jgi:hypothetical protein